MKKEYIAPSIDVTEIEKTSILAASESMTFDETNIFEDDSQVGAKAQYWNTDYFN